MNIDKAGHHILALDVNDRRGALFGHLLLGDGFNLLAFDDNRGVLDIHIG